MTLETQSIGGLERAVKGLMFEFSVRVGSLPEFKQALARVYMQKGGLWPAGQPVEFDRGGFHHEVKIDRGATQTKYSLTRNPLPNSSKQTSSALISLTADSEHGIYGFEYFDPSVQSLTNTPEANNKILAVLQSL